MPANQDLTAFNTAYNDYITNKCTLTSTTEPCKTNVNTLTTAYNTVAANYNDTTYASEYNEFNNVYLSNKKLQDELRAKMKELNKTPDSLYAEHQSVYDSAIYMNIIATVLATSLLYFIFVKLE
jgi:ATP-dependent Zn protease